MKELKGHPTSTTPEKTEVRVETTTQLGTPTTPTERRTAGAPQDCLPRAKHNLGEAQHNRVFPAEVL